MNHHTNEKFNPFKIFLTAIILISILILTPVSPAQAATVCYVKWNASGTGNNGTSWTDAYKGVIGVQSALANANCTEIWVAAGQYLPTTGITSTSTFQLKNGVALYGGFAGTESAISQRKIIANETILNGNIGKESIMTDNVYHVVTGSGTNNTAILDGFTVMNGYADGISDNGKGGGMFSISGGPTIRNVVFKNNYALLAGGGMYNENSPLIIEGASFLDNEAATSGGGIYNMTSDVTISNVTMYANESTNGAAIFNNGSNPTITHVTIHNNTGLNGGTTSAGLHNVNSDPVISNIIIWATNGPEVFNDTASQPIITNSVIEGGYPYKGGTNIITRDPRLGIYGDHGGRMMAIPLLSGSPAIDMGDKTNCSTTDQRGVSRSGQGSGCDICAYEFIPILYVKPGANTSGLCQSWVVSCDLRYALPLAVSGQQIWVSQGIHRPFSPDGNISQSDTFQLKSGVKLYGGFTGIESALDQRDWVNYPSVLYGMIGPGSGPVHAYHVVTGSGTDASAVLDGFVVQMGKADGTGSNAYGGGMYTKNGSPTLRNVVFEYNIASVAGGGIYNENSSSTISNATFYFNLSPNGGGIYNYASNITLQNVSMSNSGDKGAAIYNVQSSPIITHATLYSNTGYNGNSPWGAVFNENSSSPVIRNSILWDTEGAEPEIYNYDVSSQPVVWYSVVQHGYADGTNIITESPILGTLGNYGGMETVPLFIGSSAIDAADDTYCLPTDQRGLSRPQGSHCDIGAFEFNSVLYASPSGPASGFCETWASACDLRYAMSISSVGQQVWAKEGIHRPTKGIDRTVSFPLKMAVQVYGGFKGTETSLGQRDWIQNVTFLDGDIGEARVEGDNSFHVVTSTDVYDGINYQATILDGFIIRFGNANGSSTTDENKGGGIYISQGSPYLQNLQILANTASGGGGGVYSIDGNTVFQNVEFSYNRASWGAGLWNVRGAPQVSGVFFIQNIATSMGGGMYNERSEDGLLYNVTFVSNEAVSGGGFYDFESGGLQINNVTFSANQATAYGGGMTAEASYLVLKNATFKGNKAIYEGGGIYLSSGSGCPGCPPPKTGHTTLVNTTITGNTAEKGGGISNRDILTISNTILWGNNATSAGAQIYNSHTIDVGYSVIQGGYIGGTNIITTDPMLGTYSDNGGSTFTIPLLAGSSAINAGDDALCPATDQRGVARPQGSHCDIGAYEYQGYMGIYYVKPTASGNGNCQSWANACTLQTALSQSTYGDEIWVKAGTYKPGILREDSFQLKNGVGVYGGFNGAETARDQRDSAINLTILSGEIGAAGIGDNSYNVVVGSLTDSNTILDGFTITGGNANGPYDSMLYANGGGMRSYDGNHILKDLTFSGNFAISQGGGIWFTGGSPTLERVTFSGNSAEYGGGIYSYESAPALLNVTFSGNSAEFGGGMSSLAPSTPLLMHVTFVGNSATFGGGIYNYNSNPVIQNSILWNNTATNSGSQIYNENGTPVISDSVIQGGYIGGTNIITADPMLGALSNNGGSTKTIPLLAGSSAINAANDTDCLATDQRGVTRPQGSHCDIGAYEAEVINHTVTFNANGGSGSMSNQVANIPTALTTNTFTRTGYLFSGWNTLSGGGGTSYANGANYSFTADITLYAQWNINSYSLNYTAGTGGTLTGNTSQNVNYGAAGTTVTAVANPGYHFVNWSDSSTANPRTDTNVTANISVTANFVSDNAAIDVTIGGDLKGSYPLSNGQSRVESYGGVNGGPVVIKSNNGAKIIASYLQYRRPGLTGGWTGITQTMGLTDAEISDSYVIPYYDYADPTKYNHLQIANFDTFSTNVTVKIGGVVKETIPLGVGEAYNAKYLGVAGGPVEIYSNNGAKIVVSLYELKRAGSSGYWTGQAQMMGLPLSQLSDTYVFPRYNYTLQDLLPFVVFAVP